MSHPTGFEDAFDSVADAVARAATMPDRRDHPVVSADVTTASPEGEVGVTIRQGRIERLVIDDEWRDRTPTRDLARRLTETVNAALELWNEEHLRELEQVTPDMQQLHAAMSTARAKLQDAWVATLADARVE